MSEVEENPDKRPRRPSQAVLLLSLASLGFAGATGAFAYKHGKVKELYERIAQELTGEKAKRERAETIAQQSAEQNARLREENQYQHGVIDMQTKARAVAERRAKKAEEKARTEKQRAEAAEQKAKREAERAIALAAARDREKERADALEEDNARMKESEETASERNLGAAIESLERLERSMPDHAALDGDDRLSWLRYDCSLLRRLKYDLNRGSSDEAWNAKARWTILFSRFEDDCAEAQQ
jgi:hypothetical protein